MSKSARNIMRKRRRLKGGLRHMVDYIDIDNLVIVEVGSYAGESTEIFCSHSKCLKLFAVDPWVNGYDPKDGASEKYDMAEVEKWFDVRMESFNNFSKLKETSETAALKFKDGSVDLVYIDGDHRYDPVCADIKLWLPKISERGYISGHDYTARASVRKAVDDTLGTPDKTFEDSSWILKRSNFK